MSAALGLSIASHSGLPPAADRRSWPGRPSGPASARCSWPRGTATRWRCATRWRPRPGGSGWAPRSRTRRCARRCWRPRPRRSSTRRPAAGSSSASASANAVMNTRFGLPPFAPLPMIEEYVGVVRAVLDRGTGVRRPAVPHRDGPAGQPAGPRRPAGLPGRARAADARPGRPDRRRRDPQPDDAGPGGRRRPAIVRDAARAAGRDPASVEVACVVHCCLSDDDGRGRRGGARRRPALRAASRRAAAVRRAGRRRRAWAACASACWPATGRARPTWCRSRRPTGSWPGAAPRRIAARLAEYRAAGVDLPVIFPMPVGGDWGYERTIAALADS